MGDEEAEDAIVLLKENVLKTCNELPYKVYNSVPVVLYLNHSVRPGVPTVTKP
jgi:hypothetical protein